MIAELIGSTGEARVIDLAHRLGVTHVTVSRTIRRLQREGLVTSLPYRSIFLTDSLAPNVEEMESMPGVALTDLWETATSPASNEGSADAVARPVKLEPPKAGTAEGYSYSDANKKSGITWNEAQFKDYIKDPKAKIPGTEMAFVGIKNEKEVNDLWAFLAQYDKDGKTK